MDGLAESPLVSICIPTFNRPELLRDALESCFAQDFGSFEIIVGDDSNEDRSQSMIFEFQARFPGKIRYLRNLAPLGQAENVNLLFKNAAGLRLVLLHDDDLLLPGALRALSDCWRHTPALAAAFGKQHIVNMKGDILREETESLNVNYRRTADAAGAVAPGLAGILRMFPNDGYMVLTEKARAIGFRPFSEVGPACDFDFALRYCADNGKIWFHDAYISAYRISDDAISRTALTAPFVYRILKEYRRQRRAELSPQIVQVLRGTIARFAPSAVSGNARLGNGFEALRILSSSDYTLRDRFRLRFMLHSALTFAALVSGIRGVRLIVAAVDGYHNRMRKHEAAG